MKSLSPGNLFSGVLELKDLLQRLPSRINKIIDAIANNELKVSVDAIDEKTLVVGFQKVANRITVGLIIAALIVGAAMLMQVETTFRIWGYPGLAIILFSPPLAVGWSCSSTSFSTTKARSKNPPCGFDQTWLDVL